MINKGDNVIAKYSMIPDYAQRITGCLPIKKGYIDKVRDVVLNGTGILLENIINPPNPTKGLEFCYAIEGFEKLISDSELLEYKMTISEPEINPIPILEPEKIEYN